MKIIAGNIKGLGNSKRTNDQAIYSIIEIGSETIQNAQIADSLDNFLIKALKQNGETTLYIHRKTIYGITLPDGKSYYSGLSWLRLVSAISTILIFTALLLIGAIASPSPYNYIFLVVMAAFLLFIWAISSNILGPIKASSILKNKNSIKIQI